MSQVYKCKDRGKPICKICSGPCLIVSDSDPGKEWEDVRAQDG